jgi:hypothetical protein
VRPAHGAASEEVEVRRYVPGRNNRGLPAAARREHNVVRAAASVSSHGGFPMARRIARPIHVVVAWLLVAGLLVQVFLAGMGVFDSSSAFVTHRDFGYTLTLLPVVLIVTSLVGGFGRMEAIAAAVMFGQFILQSVFVLQRESNPAIAALHPVNGFLVLLISVWLARDAWHQFRSADDREPAAEAAPSESTTG